MGSALPRCYNLATPESDGKVGMRVRLGNEHHPHHGNRSYLDAADDILALPLRELMRIARAAERDADIGDPYSVEPLPEFLDRVYGLASQI